MSSTITAGKSWLPHFLKWWCSSHFHEVLPTVPIYLGAKLPVHGLTQRASRHFFLSLVTSTVIWHNSMRNFYWNKSHIDIIMYSFLFLSCDECDEFHVMIYDKERRRYSTNQPLIFRYCVQDIKFRIELNWTNKSACNLNV